MLDLRRSLRHSWSLSLLLYPPSVPSSLRVRVNFGPRNNVSYSCVIVFGECHLYLMSCLGHRVSMLLSSEERVFLYAAAPVRDALIGVAPVVSLIMDFVAVGALAKVALVVRVMRSGCGQCWCWLVGDDFVSGSVPGPVFWVRKELLNWDGLASPQMICRSVHHLTPFPCCQGLRLSLITVYTEQK
jgi:hypothetical protein